MLTCFRVVLHLAQFDSECKTALTEAAQPLSQLWQQYHVPWMWSGPIDRSPICDCVVDVYVGSQGACAQTWFVAVQWRIEPINTSLWSRVIADVASGPLVFLVFAPSTHRELLRLLLPVAARICDGCKCILFVFLFRLCVRLHCFWCVGRLLVCVHLHRLRFFRVRAPSESSCGSVEDRLSEARESVWKLTHVTSGRRDSLLSIAFGFGRLQWKS